MSPGAMASMNAYQALTRRVIEHCERAPANVWQVDHMIETLLDEQALDDAVVRMTTLSCPTGFTLMHANLWRDADGGAETEALSGAGLGSESTVVSTEMMCFVVADSCSRVFAIGFMWARWCSLLRFSHVQTVMAGTTAGGCNPIWRRAVRGKWYTRQPAMPLTKQQQNVCVSNAVLQVPQA